MFKFLRKLFEEKQEKEQIALKDLEKWFTSKSDVIYKEVKEQLASAKDEFNNISEKLKENLEILSKAELHNPKISVREIQFMKGNRNFYIKRVSIFLKQISFPESITDIKSNCDEFSKMLESFGKSTAKSYHILQEFFGHESNAIAQNIKQFDLLFKKLRNTVTRTYVSTIANTKKSIKELSHKIIHKKKLKLELVDKKKDIQALEERLQQKKKALQTLADSEEQKRLDQLKKQKEDIITKLKEQEIKIFHYFSILEMALKKYYHIAFENKVVVEKYLKNPVKTLIKDSEFIILEILSKLKSLIESNSIALKYKKREKTLSTVNELNRDLLSSLIGKYNELNDKIRSVEEQISSIKVIEKKDKIKREISDITLKLNQKKNEKEKLERDINHIDIPKLKKYLEESIKTTVRTDVEIL